MPVAAPAVFFRLSFTCENFPPSALKGNRLASLPPPWPSKLASTLPTWCFGQDFRGWSRTGGEGEIGMRATDLILYTGYLPPFGSGSSPTFSHSLISTRWSSRLGCTFNLPTKPQTAPMHSGLFSLQRKSNVITFNAYVLRIPLVLGTCSETRKMYHGVFFLNLTHGNV